MTSWKDIFLVKSMLGRTTNLSCPEDVIFKCAGLAYRDMLDGGRFYLSNNKESRCRGIIEILEKHNYTFSREIIDEACNLFGSEEEISGTRGRYVTRYGLAQKFVNMMFKYLYVFSDYTKKDIDFSQCDCPLDSIILGKLPEISSTWTKITAPEYTECQNEIAAKLKKKPLDMELQVLGNLAFDFLSW